MFGVLAAECLSEMEQESVASLAAGVLKASLPGGMENEKRKIKKENKVKIENSK